jgi:hypothetical protein
MTDSPNEIEVGESIEVAELLDDHGNVMGTVVDDVVVVTGEAGSIVDETIDVLDEDGNLVMEEEIVDVYDADANLVAETDTLLVVEDD